MPASATSGRRRGRCWTSGTSRRSGGGDGLIGWVPAPACPTLPFATVAEGMDLVRRADVYAYRPLNGRGVRRNCAPAARPLQAGGGLAQQAADGAARCGEERAVGSRAVGSLPVWNGRPASRKRCPVIWRASRRLKTFFMGLGRGASALVGPARLGCTARRCCATALGGRMRLLLQAAAKGEPQVGALRLRCGGGGCGQVTAWPVDGPDVRVGEPLAAGR